MNSPPVSALTWFGLLGRQVIRIDRHRKEEVGEVLPILDAEPYRLEYRLPPRRAPNTAALSSALSATALTCTAPSCLVSARPWNGTCSGGTGWKEAHADSSTIRSSTQQTRTQVNEGTQWVPSNRLHGVMPHAVLSRYGLVTAHRIRPGASGAACGGQYSPLGSLALWQGLAVPQHLNQQQSGRAPGAPARDQTGQIPLYPRCRDGD